MDAETIQKLFVQTLTGEYEGEKAWAAIDALRRDGSREVFERAAEWCSADDALKRDRAAAILCQLRRPQQPDFPDRPEWVFRDESFTLIATMLENEADPIVLDSAISALGHLDNPKAVPLVSRFQNHPDQDVRFAVAFALGCFPDEPQSIAGLLLLTRDASCEVRDWAVFGLGVLGDGDSTEIRESLLRCLNDPDEDVREESAVGLGKRHDRRLIPRLRAMLDASELTFRMAEAASALLELDGVPADWIAGNYKDALKIKFSLE
jgi:HEAT repeat protein